MEIAAYYHIRAMRTATTPSRQYKHNVGPTTPANNTTIHGTRSKVLPDHLGNSMMVSNQTKYVFSMSLFHGHYLAVKTQLRKIWLSQYPDHKNTTIV